MSLIFCFGGCKKEEYATFPTPDWKEDQTGKYPYSMTAVVSLYYDINAEVMPEDKMAAFVGDECRGIGKWIKIGPTSSAFFILIHGTASEQKKLNFKYYSSKNRYLYTTSDFLDFKVDTNFGTADKPEILDMKPVK